MRIHRKSVLFFGASCLALIYSGGAIAQRVVAGSAPPAPRQSETDAQTQGLAEIVVTANRRAESQQNIPISVTALSGSTLQASGIASTEDLQIAVPGLSTGRQVALGAFFLRGVGAQNAAHATESPVAVFVDDVYIVGNAATLFEFSNIDHIEVLKGPQSTLFGRNATGGVIHIVTRDPERNARLDASAGYGNYQTASGDLYASTPLTETLRANFSFHGVKQYDGWGKNLNNGEDMYLGWTWGVRSKLLFEPSPDTYIRLNLDYNKQRSQVGLGLKPQPGTFIVGCVPATAACRLGYEGFYNTRDLHANTYSGGTVLTPADEISDFSTTKQYGASLKVMQDMDFARIVSISSYRRLQSNFSIDQDGGPVLTSDSFLRQFDRNYQQELQLQSSAGSPFTWIVGGYYLHDDARYNPYVNRGAGRGGNRLEYFATQITTSVAAFAQATIPLFTDTNLTLGARYTRDKRRVSARFRSLSPANAVVSSGIVGLAAGVQPQTTWPKTTFRAALDHHFARDVMVYGSFNRGFKSGVYNLLTPPPGAAPTVSFFAKPAAPEVLDAYEVGFKTEFFNNHLRFNGAGFIYDYTNLQVTSISTGITSTINAGAARIKGLEFDLVVEPVNRLTLTAGVSILHGRYTRFPGAPHNVPQGTPGTPLVAGAANICTNEPFRANSVGGMVSGVAPGNSGCDLSGRETVRTPPFTGVLSARYVIPTAFGGLNLNANYAHTARFYWEFDNSVKSPPSDVVNASIGWTSRDEKFDATVWVKNLLREKIYSYANNTSLGQLFSPAPPRTFGIRFGVHLGG